MFSRRNIDRIAGLAIGTYNNCVCIAVNFSKQAKV